MDGGASEEPEKKRSRIDDIPCTLNLMSIPPLLDLSLMQVVTCLWQLPSLGSLNDYYKAIKRDLSNTDASIACRRFVNCFRCEKSEVEDRLSLLELPEVLKSKASCIVEHMGYQILHWLNSEMCVAAFPELVDSICWTSFGTVHGVGTIEKLLAKHDPGGVVDQFRAAAYCCAENLVVDLWHKMSDDVKRDLSARRTFAYHDDHLVAYWALFCDGHLDKLLQIILSEDEDLKLYDRNHSVERNMCRLAVSTGNLSGTEYFWAKLSDEERRSDVESLIRSVLSINCHPRMRRKHYRRFVISDASYEDRQALERFFHQMVCNTNSSIATLCFLISNVRSTQQMQKIIEWNRTRIMRVLCKTWPFYRFLVPIVSFAGCILPFYIYLILLKSLLQFIPLDEADDMLCQLWEYIPRCIRESLIDVAIGRSARESDSTESIRELIQVFTGTRLTGSHSHEILCETDYNYLIEHGHANLITVIKGRGAFGGILDSRARSALILGSLLCSYCSE